LMTRSNCLFKVSMMFLKLNLLGLNQNNQNVKVAAIVVPNRFAFILTLSDLNW